jgi:hypothetical protein
VERIGRSARLPGQYCNLNVLPGSVADPEHFDTNPDPALHFDTDPTFHFDTDLNLAI